MISGNISSNITREIEARNVALPREVGGTKGVESVVDWRKRAERQGLGGSPIARCGTLEFASSCFPPASPVMLHLRGEADLVDVARLRPSGRSNEKEGEV